MPKRDAKKQNKTAIQERIVRRWKERLEQTLNADQQRQDQPPPMPIAVANNARIRRCADYQQMPFAPLVKAKCFLKAKVVFDRERRWERRYQRQAIR